MRRLAGCTKERRVKGKILKKAKTREVCLSKGKMGKEGKGKNWFEKVVGPTGTELESQIHDTKTPDQKERNHSRVTIEKCSIERK